MNTLLKKLAIVATAGTVCSLVGVESASAAAFNNRPLPSGQNTFNSSSLTQILGPSSGGGINSGINNVVTDQSDIALWSAASPNTNQSSVTMIIELAGLSGSNRFGIYDANDANNRIQIFEGNDVGNATLKEGARLTFSPSGSGYNVTVAEISGGAGGSEDPATTTFISSANFGFYIDSTSPASANSGIFYTEDDKNAAGSPQALVYGGTNQQLYLPGSETGNTAPVFEQSKDWILAWEDIKYGSSDKDFNDMVLFVDNVGAVPEPLTMLGAGAAAGLGAFFKRQTAKKQKK